MDLDGGRATLLCPQYCITIGQSMPARIGIRRHPNTHHHRTADGPMLLSVRLDEAFDRNESAVCDSPGPHWLNVL